jgi:hypothetical protein
LIFEIYESRNSHGTEIDHHVTNSFIPLEEYTCVFFINKWSMRRISELKLLEFIAGLKYYVGFWPRAIIFARLCGIMGSIEKNGSSSNNCDLGWLGINDYDIYTQHFFFWVYKQIFSKSQETFSESLSGNTWLDAKKIPKLNG